MIAYPKYSPKYLDAVSFEGKKPLFQFVDAESHEGETEWRAQEEIVELVRIFGRDIAQEKVANMLLIAFKETGR